MFSRAAGLPFTCLRCQTWLACRNQLQSTPRVPSSLPNGFRWQSAVALRLEDEDHDTPSPNNPNLNEVQSQDIITRAGEPHEIVVDKQKPRDKTKIRRWRPHNAEKLGVSALGKPAEILILPSRERRTTPVTPEKEEEQSGSKAGVQQSLDSESKPVALKDVLGNIESIRNEHGKHKQEFPASEWRDIKTHLARGFTKSQLQEYLRTGTGTDMAESTHTKRLIAARIMTRVWKWKNRDAEETHLQVEPKLIEKSVVVDATKLNYITLHENQHLDHLSEALGVQINVYKKKGRISVSGSASAIQEACDDLNTLKQRIRIHTLQIPERLRDFLSNSARSEDLLRALMQKHELFIHRGQDNLRIAGTIDAAADVVLRDLVLASDTLRKASAFSIFGGEDEQQVIQIPFYSDGLSRWLQPAIDWHRYISTQARDVQDADKAITSKGREVRNLARRVLKKEKPDRSKLSLFKIVPGLVQHEYFAELGQALFRPKATESQTHGSLSDDHAIAESVLVLQQALLPQVLAWKDFVPWTGKDDVQTQRPATHPRPLLLRLQLHPFTVSNVCPPIEIFLSGLDASLGLRQKLKIEKVFVVLDQWQHTLLLTQEPLDILMIRQSKVDLLGVNGTEPPKAYIDILRQLSSYLEQAQSSTKLEMPPIWRLDTSSLLADKSIDQTNSNAGEATSMYVLEPPELLNVTTYTSAFAGDHYIDHVTYNTDPVDKHRQKQSLRISAYTLTQLLHNGSGNAIKTTRDIIEKQRLFAKSVASAYQFAAMLSDAARAAGHHSKATEITNAVS